MGREMTDVSLGPAAVNLKGIVENDAWSIALTLTAGGDPYDLTGATIVAKMKLSSGSVVLTTNVTDAPGGMLTVSQADAPLIGSGGKWALRINGRTIIGGGVSGAADVLA
jgi:hypothetical protein